MEAEEGGECVLSVCLGCHEDEKIEAIAKGGEQ